MQLTGGERGRLDRSRWRPANGPAALVQLTSAPNSEGNLLHHLFGETPNRATGTVALPFSDCIVPAKA